MPKALTILHMNPATVLGGAERVLLMAMEQARMRGHRPLLACPEGGRLPETARAANFEVFPCDFAWMENRISPRDVLGYARSVRHVGRRVLEICREQSVDLLHPASPVAGLYALRAAKEMRLPILLHMHDAQPPKKARRAVIHYQAQAVSGFVCVSECVRAMVTGLGIPAEKTAVLHNAVGAEFLGPAPEPNPCVTGPGPHIGLFGQIVPWKGQHVFLEAAARLARKWPDARFYVVGTLAHKSDQPYLDELNAMASGPDLAGRAVLTGYQPDVRAWMAAMDAVAHASVEPEAFGLVIVEAMALGKPVVATATGGPAEIIEDGETGRLVQPGDPDAMADALEQVLADREMGRRAASAVRARFTPDRFGTALMQVYKEAINDE